MMYVLSLSIGFIVIVVAFGIAKMKFDLSIHPIYATALRGGGRLNTKENAFGGV